MSYKAPFLFSLLSRESRCSTLPKISRNTAKSREHRNSFNTRRSKFERLENRELLSVSGAEYAAIREANIGMELPEDLASLNVTEIVAEDLNAVNLKALVESAIATPEDDLIVVRTGDESNVVSFNSDDVESLQTLAYNPKEAGRIMCVASGTQALTLEAPNLDAPLVFTPDVVYENLAENFLSDSTTQIPATPSDVYFGLYDATTRSVTINWTDNSGDESGFRIENSSDDGQTWNFVGTADQDQTSFLCKDVSIAQTQIFRIAAFNDSGYSNWSEEYYAPSVPEAPGNLTFGDYDVATQTVTASWIDKSDNETGFRVECSKDNGATWSLVGEVEADQTSILCQNVTVDAPHIFRVQAFNDEGLSTWTAATFTVPAPEAPSDVVFGTYDAKTRSVVMSWTDNSDVEAGFRIEYSLDGGYTWTLAEIVSSDVTSHVCSNIITRQEYIYRVGAFNSGGQSAWAEASLKISEPNAPSDVVFKDYDPTTKTMTISWTDNSDDETGFKVEYSKDGGKTWAVSGILGANQTSKLCRGITNYYAYNFRVSAFNNVGYSDYAEGTFAAPAPEAPGDITFGTYDSKTRSVVMSWIDNSDNETGYRVEYSTDSGQTWKLASILGANATSRVCKGVYADRSYVFRVAAFNAGGYSAWTEGYFSISKPDAPSDVVFTNYDATTRTLQMSWTDNSEDEKGFRVEYSKDAGKTWTLSEILDANTTGRVCWGVASNRTYAFRVYAFNDAGLSAPATGYFSASAPAAPSNVVFSNYDPTARTVEMSWTDNSGNELGFRVEYSKDDGATWTLAETLSANVTSRVCRGINANQTYIFRVTAFNSAGDSSPATGTFSAAKPAAPGNIVFSEYRSQEEKVKMSWDDASNNELGFVVQVSLDEGETWYNVEKLDANQTTRTCSEIRPNHNYLYRVTAFNYAGRSDWTYASFSSCVPTAPGDITFGAYDPATQTVTMSWSDNSDNEAGFRIEYCKNDETSWTLAETTGANVTSRVCHNIAADKEYRFRVTAFNAAGLSEYATATFKNTIPEAPSDVVFGTYDQEAHKVLMSWTDNSNNETGFKVEYSKDGGKTWKTAETVGANVTSRTCKGVYLGQTYDFRVAAFNALGTSDWTYGRFTPALDEQENETGSDPLNVEENLDQNFSFIEIFADLKDESDWFDF